jgi:hypothetical protein
MAPGDATVSGWRTSGMLKTIEAFRGLDLLDQPGDAFFDLFDGLRRSAILWAAFFAFPMSSSDPEPMSRSG